MHRTRLVLGFTPVQSVHRLWITGVPAAGGLRISHTPWEQAKGVPGQSRVFMAECRPGAFSAPALHVQVKLP